MTGPELDALIARSEHAIELHQSFGWDTVAIIISELKIYRAMSLRLERCVHELVKENDKAQEELKDMDRQINLRLMATNAMEKATARLDEALGAGIDTPPQVPGWRRMDKMPEHQPQATKGVPVETAPCPDCGAFPYTAEAQFYSGLGAVAVCASCKKPYKPVIVS